MSNFANKNCDIDEMVKLLERYKLLKLVQKEIILYHRNVIKTLPTQKTLGSDGFTTKLNQIIQGKIMPVLSKLFQKTKDKKHFLTPNQSNTLQEQKSTEWSAWVAQSVEHLTLGFWLESWSQDCEIEPCLRFHAQRGVWLRLSIPLSLPPALSASQKKKKT